MLLNDNLDNTVENMAGPSDSSGLLSEEALSRFAEVKRSRRRTWAEADHLRIAKKRNGYGELDVLEVVAFAELVRALDWDDALSAWRDVRPVLRDRPLANRYFVLYDLRLSSAELLDSEEAIGARVVNGHAFRVLDLTARLVEARTAYRKLARTKTRIKAPAKD